MAIPKVETLLLDLALVSLLLCAPAAGAQDGPGAGVNREQMWPAPGAEDWKRPCLVIWQRTWEDALAVSRETGKAILVCINMDGEIASEHYAGVRYRQPEIASLYQPYVTVIASVYRHNPRDHDEEGQRILCPRFGSVTCGEHIAIEPILYEKFMDGQRIAPRHIGVEIDGTEMYDVFYAWDTDTIFNSLKDGIANRPNTEATVVRGDRPIVERVVSRDVGDRAAVESAYQQGDPALRGALLDAAFAHPDTSPVDLLRLAVFGFDVELSRKARRALAQSKTPAATELISEALRVPMDTRERDALIGTLERIGQSSPRARTLSVVHRGLASRSSALDVDGWSKALAAQYKPAYEVDGPALEHKIQSQNEVLKTEDAAAHLELAEAFLDRAFDSQGRALEAEGLGIDESTEGEFTRFLFLDAQRTALEAERLGASGWRLDAVLALATYYLRNNEVAHARAESAVKSLPSGEQGFNAMAVLELFAKMRCQAISMAVQGKTDWPAQWLTDVHAACSVLARHPLGTDAQVAWHYDILKWLGGAGQAARVLDEGLARHPDSWALHERLRSRTLEEKGVDGLESAYAAMLHRNDAPSSLQWYAGYASFIAAEFHRRAGDAERALAAYERGIGQFERWIEENPDGRDTADLYVALALAGRARLAFERGDDENAVAELIRSFDRKPDTAATLDGLNISPADTARALLSRLEEKQRTDLLARLQAALLRLDPALLRLPEYERAGPADAASGGSPPRRQREPQDP